MHAVLSSLAFTVFVVAQIAAVIVTHEAFPRSYPQRR